ncbi:hypothetical protein VCSRO205_3061 [Vibrio cholerae]|nr:hypothetical protein VCSRO205_3061 [Vibrio cholerae]
MNNRLVEETIAEETIDCCPLCQHDEFFISADKEKFYCAKCGFSHQHSDQHSAHAGG